MKKFFKYALMAVAAICVGACTEQDNGLSDEGNKDDNSNVGDNDTPSVIAKNYQLTGFDTYFIKYDADGKVSEIIDVEEEDCKIVIDRKKGYIIYEYDNEADSVKVTFTGEGYIKTISDSDYSYAYTYTNGYLTKASALFQDEAEDDYAREARTAIDLSWKNGNLNTIKVVQSAKDGNEPEYVWQTRTTSFVYSDLKNVLQQPTMAMGSDLLEGYLPWPFFFSGLFGKGTASLAESFTTIVKYDVADDEYDDEEESGDGEYSFTAKIEYTLNQDGIILTERFLTECEEDDEEYEEDSIIKYYYNGDCWQPESSLSAPRRHKSLLQKMPVRK